MGLIWIARVDMIGLDLLDGWRMRMSILERKVGSRGVSVFADTLEDAGETL